MGNNIVSYFIKNIKDKKERSYYKQKINRGLYIILYKDEIILFSIFINFFCALFLKKCFLIMN